MKKINIAELLKDCPIGMELGCTEYDGIVKFEGFNKNHPYPIRIVVSHDGVLATHSLTKYGQTSISSYNKCVIFPKGKTTWEGFVPPCKFKEGDVVISIYGDIHLLRTENSSYCSYRHSRETKLDPILTTSIAVVRLATEEEKGMLFQAITDNGYRWNDETKTLEKLPKFKVGDKVRGKYTNSIYTISGITPTGYKLTNGQSFDFDAEDCHELIPNKFDIATLKPFSEVLVRYDNDAPWMTAHFSHYMKDAEWEYPYFASGACFKQCIPIKAMNIF